MAEYVCGDGRMSVNGICSIPNQGNNNITKDYSKDVKSNFQWDFDKVGNKIENFNETIKSSTTSFDSYVQENLGIKNVAVGLALGPYAIPYSIGKSIFNNYKTNQNQTIDNDPQGSNNTVDMATFGIPEVGQPGFNIHNDSYDQGGGYNSGDGGSYSGMGEAADWGGGE